MTLSLEQSTDICRLLADPSRLRLLLLLEAHELTMAELAEVTGLAQSRVSTHLARLRTAGLVHQQRRGGAALFAAASGSDSTLKAVWELLRDRLTDQQARLDRERALQVIRARAPHSTWAESVAGRMELHYSPGRTWEATARALIHLLQLGEVADVACGDGVLAELIAERARSVTCVDISRTLIAAARRRLREVPHVRFVEADMHALPLPERRYDQVFLMHALAYTREPRKVLAEAARILRPGGQLVVTALNEHKHKATMQAYDHLNLGLSPAALRKLLEGAGLVVDSCRVSSREPRPPYFEVVTALARPGRSG